MSRPFDELKAIANTWGTLTRDPNPTQNDLAIAAYHTMVDRSAVRGVWGNIEPESRAFVSWLLDQRNMLALVDDLPALLASPPDETAALLEHNRRIGLVDVDEVLVRGSRVVSSGDNLYAWASRSQTEATRRKVVSVAAEAAKLLREVIEESKRPPPFEEPFSVLLNNLDQEEVQRVAATWKLPEANRYYKSELVGVMGEFLATTQGRELVLSSLGQTARGLFAYLDEHGGKLSAAAVKQHFGWEERELRAALSPLVQRALVWDVLASDRRYLYIPVDLLRPVQSGDSPSSSTAIQSRIEAANPTIIEAQLPYEMPWDLLTLLAFAGKQELSLTLQDGRITKRLAKKINEAFLHPSDVKVDSEYIDILVHFARCLGLLTETAGEQPTLRVTNKTEEWAQLSFQAQRHRIYAFWQGDRKWAEPAAYGTIYWWNSDLTAARARLAAHLTALPPNSWVSLEGFLRHIHTSEPFIIWSQDELVRRFGLRALQGFRNQWFEIEGRIVADMLRTMLFWLGAVDIGRDKQKRFVSFRVTEHGRGLLDPASASESGHAPSKALLVQPNFEVLVLEPDSRVVWTLLKVADLVRHDRVSVYGLNKDSVARGVEDGLSPDEIVTFLQKNTGKGLPQNVAHSIHDWARRIKRLEILQATLIEVDDASVLDELLASRKTKRFVLRRLSPTTAIALLPEAGDTSREDPIQKLVKELRAAGYLPRVATEGQVGEINDQILLHTPVFKGKAVRATTKSRARRAVPQAKLDDDQAANLTKRTGTS